MRRFLVKSFLWGIGIFSLLVNLSYAQPSIVIMGDSLSAGYGIDISKGWVAQLKHQLEKNGYSYEVVNLSISGETTTGIKERLPKILKNYSHSIFIIQIGGNDGLRGTPIATIKENLALSVNMLLKQQHHVILVGVRLPPNYGEEYVQEFINIYPYIVKKYANSHGTKNDQILLVSNLLQGIDEDLRLMQEDGIHPREPAQKTMLENVWPVLEKILVK